MPIDTKALARLGAQTRITQLFAEIESLMKAFPGIGKVPARLAEPAKGRTLSSETKAKMRAAWARRKAAVPATAAPPAEAPTKKRTMSAAGRAAIAAAQKKRWAAIKKAKKR